MTIALQLIKTAMRSIQVLESGEEPDGPQGIDALASLNQMIHGWRNRNVDVEHVDLTLTDEIKLDERHHEGLTYLLAVRLAPEYNTSVSPEVALLAETGWRGIQSHYTIPNSLQIEGINRMPSSRWGSNS